MKPQKGRIRRWLFWLTVMGLVLVATYTKGKVEGQEEIKAQAMYIYANADYLTILEAEQYAKQGAPE